MCACRLEAKSTPSTPGSVGAIEEYYPFLCVGMGDDHGGGGKPPGPEGEDLYTQIAEKDRDLMLAAELGKALLEQNEEMKKKHDQSIEEYTVKLDQLTQDKHHLKLRMEVVESEYNTTVRELHADIAGLRQELQEERQQSQASEKNRSQIISELTQQNERLTEQLKQVSHGEEQLVTQVTTLRSQVASRRTTMHDHVHQLQILRDEINMLTDRNSDLERRIVTLTEERDTLSSSLEEAQDRILMLERQKLEQEQTIRHQDRELNELHEETSMLQDKVDSVSNTSHVSLNDTSNSLLSELETSGIIDSASPDSLDVSPSTNHVNKTPGQQLKEEILEVYGLLQQMVLDLKGQGDTVNPDSLHENNFKAGCLIGVLRELRELMEDVVTRQKLKTSAAHEERAMTLESELQSVKKELSGTQDALDNIKVDLHFKDQQLMKSSEELTHLTNKLSLQHEELARLQEERDRLQDNSAGVTRDDIVDQARKERDDANEKRNELEMELAKARMDLMNLDSQLLDTINQKLELSQELDMWKEDMRDLVDTTVTDRLKEEKRIKMALAAAAAAAKAKQQQPQPKTRRFKFPWMS